MGGENLARRREGGALSGAIEKRAPKFHFQMLYLVRKRRLAYIARFGSSRKMEFTRQRIKISKRSQFHRKFRRWPTPAVEFLKWQFHSIVTVSMIEIRYDVAAVYRDFI
jgi:hypothetical protein